MSQTETVDIDIELVEKLITEETAALDAKHARSLSYREEAKAHLPGGVSSSWQTWPPHPIYVDRGKGSHVWDIDQNEYVDYHNGYGVMVMGHAHPKIVEAVQKRVALGTHFAQPTEDALLVAENLAERTGLSVLAVRQLGDRGHARRGAHHARHHRASADPEDRGHLPRPPRRADGERVPVEGGRGPARAPELGAADARHDPRHGRHRAERAVQRRRRGRAGVRGARRRRSPA